MYLVISGTYLYVYEKANNLNRREVSEKNAFLNNIIDLGRDILLMTLNKNRLLKP